MGSNKIRATGENARIYVLREARTANLAAEANDQESDESVQGPNRWLELADVRLYGFSGAMLAVNPDEMSSREIAELVASAARDTGNIFLGVEASVRPAGNGCALSLPGHELAGFHVGDVLSIHPASELLVLTPYSPSDESEEATPTETAFSSSGIRDRARLAEDLVSLRREQLGIADQ
jgi:hypothetical protein